MKLTPMFASDTTAAAVGLTVLCLIIAAGVLGLIFGGLAIAMNRKLRKRTWGGLMLAICPLIFSLPAFALAISIYKAPILPGFPNELLIAISALPLLFAIYAYLLWRRAPKNQSDDPR